MRKILFFAILLVQAGSSQSMQQQRLPPAMTQKIRNWAERARAGLAMGRTATAAQEASRAALEAAEELRLRRGNGIQALIRILPQLAQLQSLDLGFNDLDYITTQRLADLIIAIAPKLRLYI